MECKLVTRQDEASVKKLWSYCFEKEDHPFFKWYFFNVYTPNNVLGVYGNDTLLGCLHLNPYQIYLRGQVWPVSYVVGVGTYPNARNKGVAKTMLINAFAEMRHSGHYLSLLMPFRADFYSPYGFALCYKYCEYEIPLADLKNVLQHRGDFYEVQENDIADLTYVHNKFMASKHGYVIRNEQEWKRWIAAHKVEQGMVYLLKKNGQAQGYVVYYVLADKIVVKEMAYTCFDAQKAILSLLYSHYSQVDKLVWEAPSDDQLLYALPNPQKYIRLKPHMMARIIDVEQVFSKICFENEGINGICIKVIDEYAVWNNQTFRLKVVCGIVEVQPLGEHNYDICFSIGALTQLIFGERSAKELQFAGELTGNQEVLQIFADMFPGCSNYFNEEF